MESPRREPSWDPISAGSHSPTRTGTPPAPPVDAVGNPGARAADPTLDDEPRRLGAGAGPGAPGDELPVRFAAIGTRTRGKRGCNPCFASTRGEGSGAIRVGFLGVKTEDAWRRRSATPKRAITVVRSWRVPAPRGTLAPGKAARRRRVPPPKEGIPVAHRNAVDSLHGTREIKARRRSAVGLLCFCVRLGEGQGGPHLHEQDLGRTIRDTGRGTTA